ncbi:uncharacterized protein METZ01_LOCUS354079 [marine metagenome]|uniref:Uncharacterized protein n=1 Tax=marine metagenome TaxID=408172 RepID=A0A382RVP0_9ZZZZ
MRVRFHPFAAEQKMHLIPAHSQKPLRAPDAKHC